MLEALHPGRIDLGIGRAPGTDQLTARALRRSPGAAGGRRLPRAARRADGLLRRRVPRRAPVRRASRRCRASATGPALWLLGSSDYSAQAAGMLGLPFSFAHHFAAGNTEPAVQAYRAAFRPVGRPRRALRDARRVRGLRRDRRRGASGSPGSGALAFLRLRSGPARPLPDARGGGRVPVHPARARGDQGVDVLAHRRRPAGRCGRRSPSWPTRTGADELMITTLTHSPDARLASYRLVAGAAGLSARPRSTVDAGRVDGVTRPCIPGRDGLGSSSQAPIPRS